MSVTFASLHPFNPVITLHDFTSGAPVQLGFRYLSGMPRRNRYFTFCEFGNELHQKVSGTFLMKC